ncbi:hypothetical protein M0804_012944 [Polistes exclamans]|nr:hypothetical protein M0804_012944 [Polistes exclamans]
MTREVEERLCYSDTVLLAGNTYYQLTPIQQATPIQQPASLFIYPPTTILAFALAACFCRESRVASGNVSLVWALGHNAKRFLAT